MTFGSPPSERPGDRGFRRTSGAVDCVIEAWGPDRVACLAEAVGGLVGLFTEVPDAAATTTLPVVLESAPAPDLLVTLLEEVIATVDVFGKVPAHVHLAEAEDGGVAGDLEVVDADTLHLTGPVPKSVSWHGLEFGETGGAWRCRVVVSR